MYAEYFGFREEPFVDIADPRFFYTNPLQQKAYATLLSGIREHKGFVLLTGEAGTGKTTILRRVMHDLETSSRPLFFDRTGQTCTSVDELLSFLCAQLGVLSNGADRIKKLHAVRDYLITLAQKGGTGVLVIDEAHHLSDEVLNDLRMIAPLDAKGERLLLQIVLVGQPTLEVKLKQSKLRPIQQRIALRYELTPFADQEVSPYIQYRLAMVGCERQDLFSPEAIARIAGGAKGLPRLINVICDNALLLTCGKLQETVSAATVDEIVAGLGLGPVVSTRKVGKRKKPPPQSKALLIGSNDETAPIDPSSLLPPLPGDEDRQVSIVARAHFWGYLTSVLFLAFAVGLLMYSYSQQRPRIPISAFPTDTTVPAEAEASTAHSSSMIVKATPQQKAITMRTGERKRFSIAGQAQGDEKLFEVVWQLNGQYVGQGASWTFVPNRTDAEQIHAVTATVRDVKGRKTERVWVVTVEKRRTRLNR